MSKFEGWVINMIITINNKILLRNSFKSKRIWKKKKVLVADLLNWGSIKNEIDHSLCWSWNTKRIAGEAFDICRHAVLQFLTSTISLSTPYQTHSKNRFIFFLAPLFIAPHAHSSLSLSSHRHDTTQETRHRHCHRHRRRVRRGCRAAWSSNICQRLRR